MDVALCGFEESDVPSMTGMKHGTVQFALSVRNAATVILTLFALAMPASMVFSQCANLPCCTKAASDIDRVGRPDCCNPVVAVETPSPDVVKPTSIAQPALSMTVHGLIDVIIPTRPAACLASTGQAPPIASHDRLSLLSTLLI